MNGRSTEAERYRHLYNDARWKGRHGARVIQLAKQPLCEMCLANGQYTAATVCDHVDPKTKDTEATFYAGPFQSLCKPHHDSAKQSQEKRGFSGQADDDGWPMDPRHPANAA